MVKIINLTQHLGTPEQGVIEPVEKDKVSKLLTFETIPSKTEMTERAQALAAIAREASADAAMIGGAPFFMSSLERALEDCGIRPVYAFSLRESVEAVQQDGSVKKTQVFRHVGFVEVERLKTYLLLFSGEFSVLDRGPFIQTTFQAPSYEEAYKMAETYCRQEWPDVGYKIFRQGERASEGVELHLLEVSL